MNEEILAGGFINEVVRVGDTVRRTPHPNADFVHTLLAHFEACGWAGAPRYRGLDPAGREILTYLDGFVPWSSLPPEVLEPASLRSVGRLTREFHDLTAGTTLAAGHEVVCHNDLSPKNTIYHLAPAAAADADHGARAIAFIDWDIAAPGLRIHDLAFICWQFADLANAALPEIITRWQSLCEGYGPADRSALVETVLWWQTRTINGIESQAPTNPAMAHLVAQGIPTQIRHARTLITTHAAALSQAFP